MFANKKGAIGIVIHIGGPLLVALLVIIYLILTRYSSSDASIMTEGLRNLTDVVKNVVP